MHTESKTLPKTLERLVNILSKNSNIKPAKAKELVLEAEVEVDDLMEYETFNHPVEDCYGRVLIYEGGGFEVMAMSWRPGDYSAIHNHGYTEWGVVQVFGVAQNNLFCIKDDTFQLSKKEILQPRDAIKVNNALIHQMGNPTTKPYVSLHVYGASTRENNITADAKVFELEKNRVIHTTGGAFFNLPKDQIYNAVQGIHTTQETFMHHAYLLLAYYNRQENTEELRKLKADLLQQMSAWSMEN